MEIVMINEVVLEGIVANIWRYAMALLVRVARYLHPDLMPKPLNELQNAIAFVTLQVPQSNLGTRVHGFPHGWDCADSLLGFVNAGRGAKLLAPEVLDLSELRAPGGTTEEVELRIISQMNGRKPQSFCKAS
jgi:hypothetical protein